MALEIKEKTKRGQKSCIVCWVGGEKTVVVQSKHFLRHKKQSLFVANTVKVIGNVTKKHSNEKLNIEILTLDNFKLMICVWGLKKMGDEC